MKHKKQLFLTMLTSCVFLVLCVCASAYTPSFNNEVIKQDLTSLEWCFDSPFPNTRIVKTTQWQPYIDNLGCSEADISLYIVQDTLNTKEVCRHESSCSDEVLNNGTGDYTVTTCSSVKVCEDVEYVSNDYYDVSKTDFLLSKNDRLCVKGTRKAQTGAQSCDMNFIYDDGSTRFDVKDFGKLWWNTTWNRKYEITAGQVLLPPYQPFRLQLNDSVITMSDCQADGGDVRIVDSTESTELTYYLESWDSTNGVLYINESVESSSFNGYLYCNATTPQTTTSTYLPEIDLINNLLISYKLDNTDLRDAANTNNGTNQGGTNTSGKITNALNFAAANYANYTLQSREYDTESYSYSVWLKATVAGANTDYILDDFTGAGTECGMTSQFFSNDEIFGGMQRNGQGRQQISVDYSAYSGAWTMFTHTYNHTDGNSSIYLNGDYQASVIFTDRSLNCAITEGDHETRAKPSSASEYTGDIDEINHWDTTLSPTLVKALYDQTTTYPFYADSNNTIGAGIDNVIETEINSGILDFDDYSIISNFTQEDQKFKVFVNYTYTSNSSSVSNETGAYCNFSAIDIIDEHVSSIPGTNTTLCSGACDTANYTYQFTDHLDTEGFNFDIIRLSLCRSQNEEDFTVTTDCGDSVDFPGASIPTCDQGFTNITFNTTNCGGKQEVNVSITSSAVAPVNALVLVDTLSEIDRSHNSTHNLTYNVSNGLWIDEGHRHSFIEHGNRTIQTSCIDDSAQLENQFETFYIITVNAVPQLFISSIWWWLLDNPTTFEPSIQARYPLQSSINISYLAADTDLDTVTYYLNYSNGTNIDTFMDGAFAVVNYTQGNFSTDVAFLNGSIEYVVQIFANDTTGNSTTIQRSFSAINDAPNLTISESSPIVITSTPRNITWTCNDPEGQNTTKYVYINGVLNETTTNDYHEFNFVEGSYNYSLTCGDSLRNSTEDFVVSFFSACVVNVGGITDWGRYRDTNVLLNTSCSNGVNITSCSYAIDKYASEPFTCSGQNITLEVGKNNIVVSVVDVNGFTNNVDLTVYAKKMNSSLSDFILLAIIVLALGFMIWFANNKFDTIATHFVVVVLMVLASLYIFTFSFWIGVMLLIITGIYAIWVLS